MAVSLAIKEGRLKDSVIYVNGVPKIANVELANQEWAANTDTTHSPSADDLDGAARKAKHWDALTREAKFREAVGELTPAAGVKRAVEDAFAACRSHLLALPSRARQLLPHLTTSDVGVIENVVREALEQLALKGDE